MARPVTVSATQLHRALQAFESHGRPIKSARLYPDGAVLLLSETHAEEAISVEAQPTSWVELVGTQDRFDA